MTTYGARTISVSVDCDWREVYEFASQPENLHRWASGLGSGLKRKGEEWTAQGPEGPVRIRFSPRNEFGVLDHVVVSDTGAETRNHLRVVANGTGCEVMFTLFRTPGMSKAKFGADADWVLRDLEALKALFDPSVLWGVTRE